MIAIIACEFVLSTGKFAANPDYFIVSFDRDKFFECPEVVIDSRNCESSFVADNMSIGVFCFFKFHRVLQKFCLDPF